MNDSGELGKDCGPTALDGAAAVTILQSCVGEFFTVRVLLSAGDVVDCVAPDFNVVSREPIQQTKHTT